MYGSEVVRALRLYAMYYSVTRFLVENTVSMPQNTGQEPLYYNHLPTGRPVPEGAKTFGKFTSNYLDVRNDPLYPFGFGLSYTTFKYADF